MTRERGNALAEEGKSEEKDKSAEGRQGEKRESGCVQRAGHV